MTLDDRVRAETAKFNGTVNLFAKNLDTGKTYGLQEDERVRTASTIKVPIMVEAFTQVNEGKAKWDDHLVLTKEKKAGGSGVLFEFHDGLQLTKRGRIAMAITCDKMPEVIWTDENPGYLLLSRLSSLLIDGLGK